ncbi:MAG: glycosyltransferase [Streptococcaceae bacterium]|jgi:glycosyltransferase involved in cell wall biosynthesis|nr:glycosyltransferase [Streptococcaceae bacterium]
MKKIVFAVSDLRMGGTQRVQSVIANELLLNNYDVNFFSLVKFDSYFKNNAKIIYPKNVIGTLKSKWIACLNLFQKFIFRKPVDVILTPNKAITNELIDYIKSNGIQTVVLVEQWILVAKQVKKALPKVKIVGWIHSNAQIYESHFFEKSSAQLILGYRACDDLFILTNEDKNYLKKHKINNIKVMHNPLTIKNTKISNLNSKIISFVGRIDIHTKGLDYLLDLAKMLTNDWKIYLAGQGNKLEEIRFKKMLIDNKLQSKIVWQGSKKGEDLVKHYLNSSIFISLSRFEGFPLVFGEAMSFGLPVLAFANSGSCEVTDNGKYGVLVEQGNVEKFIKQLKLLMDSKNLREKYQKLSLERAEFLSLKNIINKWKKI